MKSSDFVAEAFDNPYPYEWDKPDSNSYHALAFLDDGSPLDIEFGNQGNNEWHVKFDRNYSMRVTGEGNQQRVFATVVNAVKQFVKKRKPQKIIFSATKNVAPGQKSNSRSSLYSSLIARYATALGYTAQINDQDDQVVYELSKVQKPVAEAELSEIQRTKADAGDDWESTGQLDTVPGLKMVPGSDRYGYVLRMFAGSELGNFTGSDRSISFYDTKPEGSDKVLYIGYIQFRNFGAFGFKNAVQVSNVMLDRRYRGRDIGVMMYATALQLGYTIVADDTQTPPARRLWIKLNQTPNVVVRGLTLIMRGDIDPTVASEWADKNKILANQKKLARLGATPLTPVDQGGQFTDIAFSFPVKPGKEGSELVGKNLKIYSVKDPEDTEKYVTLYAQWAGLAESVAESSGTTDTRHAWRIQFSRFKDLPVMLPEREGKMYFMPLDENGLRTYYSLTGKDAEKIRFMPAEAYSVSGDAWVGDMLTINFLLKAVKEFKQMGKSLTPESKQKKLEYIEGLKQQYLESRVPYSQYRPGMFRMPEILAEPGQVQKLDKAVAYNKDTGELSLRDRPVKKQTQPTVTESSGTTAAGYTWQFEPGREVPMKPDVDANTFIRVRDPIGKTICGIWADVEGDSIQIEYSQVFDEELRGRGVYTDVLRSLSKQYNVISDKDNNNAATSIYKRLGADYDHRQATHTLRKQGVAEGKVKLYTDPSYFGAEVDDTGFDNLPIVNISANQLVGFEPDAKMNQPKSRANVEKIVAGLKQGAKLPPLLVRKYKNGYQVLDGHHRFWAYKLLGVKSIPSRIVPDEDIEEISKQGVAEGVEQPDLMSAFKDFLPVAMRELNIKKLPPIKLLKQVPAGDQPTFGKFVNDENVVYLGIAERHPVDILRTLAHELVHYKQNTEHQLAAGSGATGSPEENQAHEVAGVIMRDFNRLHPEYFESQAVNLSEGVEHDKETLDEILVNLCSHVVEGQRVDPDKYGMVAACVVDPDNRQVIGVNELTQDGTRRHGERVAMERYQEQYGEIPEGSIIITTCSPCNEQRMTERYGESCTDIINNSNCRKVYCGYQDPSQTDEHNKFTLSVTGNSAINSLCEHFAATFLNENFNDGKNPGRKGLSQRVGIPKNATIAQLERYKGAPGEKGRMARWQLNMRRGRNK